MSKQSQLRQQRRAFLKAAGVSIALPCLESLTHAAIPASQPVMRMVCISSALGMNPEAFFPGLSIETTNSRRR